MATTRSATEDEVFGQFLDKLPENHLPSRIEVARHILFRRDRDCDSSFMRSGKLIKSLKPATKLRIIHDICEKLIYIWQEKASIPVKSNRAIERNIETLMDEILSCSKDINSFKGSHGNKPDWKIEFIRAKGFLSLFDISLCQCFSKCKEEKEFDISLCTCKPKFPERELKFYAQQKLFGKGKILSQTDVKASLELQRARALEIKKEQESERLKNQAKKEAARFDVKPKPTKKVSTAFSSSSDDDVEDDYDSDDEDFVIANAIPKKHYNKDSYKMFISYGKRKGIPSTTLAGLLNSLRMDEGITDESKYISSHKIDCEWEKICENVVQAHNAEFRNLICIIFDGKRGKVRLARNREAMEERIACTVEPGGKYLHNFVPLDGTGYNLAKEMNTVIQLYHSEESLLATGGDNCPANTGPKIGAFKYMEQFLQRPLQRICCLLHYTELPFKHIVKIYAGPTSGPRSWSGKLGKKIVGLPENRQKVVQFEPIKGLMKLDPGLLDNQDQKYFCELAVAIQEGPEYLISKLGEDPELPGEMHSARWLKTASRIMRLFVQTKNPTEGLKRLVFVTLNWYGPTFFLVKKQWQIKYAALNFHQSIVWAKQCFTVKKESDKAVKIIQRNAFMAHSESVLLAGICHSDWKIRSHCADIIIKARARAAKKSEIRPYHPPKLNFNAESFLEMIDLSSTDVTAPPLLRDFSNKDLRQYALDGGIPIPDIPCHSVNNERHVQDTSKAAKLAVGVEKTHSHILNMHKNRAEIPTKSKKSDFQPKKN